MTTTTGLPQTCAAAIDTVFPEHLRAQAKVVSSRENRAQNPRAVGQNKDKHRSRDHGCFQINDYWQYDKGGMWNASVGFDKIYEPLFNAKVALAIYNSWQKSRGNGWKAWYGAKGIYW